MPFRVPTRGSDGSWKMDKSPSRQRPGEEDKKELMAPDPRMGGRDLSVGRLFNILDRSNKGYIDDVEIGPLNPHLENKIKEGYTKPLNASIALKVS